MSRDFDLVIAIWDSSEQVGHDRFFCANKSKGFYWFTSKGFLWSNLVTWKNKKQSVVARSGAEAEFRAMTQGLCETLWLKRVMEYLKQSLSLPIKLYCDNLYTIIVHNPALHDRTKHIKTEKHFIKEKLDERILCILFLPSL